MRPFASRLRSESGQTASEYMLLISVIVIAVVGAAYTFVPTFKDGTEALARDVSSILASGEIGGVGLDRSGGGGSNGGTGGGAVSNGASGMGNNGMSNGGVANDRVGPGYNQGLGAPSNTSGAGPGLMNINDNGKSGATVQPAVYHPPPRSGPILYST